MRCCLNLNRLSFRVIIIEQQAIAPRVKARGVYRIILQKILLTTQQTTYRSGALGNSGDKSTEEHRFPSGKGRKKPFSAESAIINAFGNKTKTLNYIKQAVKERNWGVVLDKVILLRSIIL